MRWTTYKTSLPWILVAFRGVAVPLFMWGAIAMKWTRPELWGALMIAAFLSDWADGVLARLWRTSTPGLRKADSLADISFYVHVLIAALIVHADVMLPVLPSCLGLLLLEIVCQASHFVRFRCGTATHAYLCKAWAVTLCIATTDLFLFQAVRGPMWTSIALGYVAYGDVLLIIFFASVVPIDVPSCWHAWQSRRHLHAPQPLIENTGRNHSLKPRTEG